MVSSSHVSPILIASILMRTIVIVACNLLGAVVVWCFLYESSDLTLESVNLVRGLPSMFSLTSLTHLKMYTDPNCKPWTSRRWAPPGYSSRRDLIEQVRAAEMNKQLAAMGEEERLEKTTNGSSNGNGHSQEHLTGGKADSNNV
jgi:MFS transporter, SP family, sugar:H+ symporter